MKKSTTSGIVATIAVLSMASPAFAATTYQPTHVSSATKIHATTTVSTTNTSPKTAKSKVVLLVGSVTQNVDGMLTVLAKTKTYNVTVKPTALIFSKTGKTIAQSTIKTGDQIRVRGRAIGTQVTATSMRDLVL